MAGNVSYEKIVDHALAILSGQNAPELIAGFSSQLGFLKVVCENCCIVGCYGYQENCPFPTCLPDTTIMLMEGGRVSLEGFAIGTGKDEGRVAAYLTIRD